MSDKVKKVIIAVLAIACLGMLYLRMHTANLLADAQQRLSQLQVPSKETAIKPMTPDQVNKYKQYLQHDFDLLEQSAGKKGIDKNALANNGNNDIGVINMLALPASAGKSEFAKDWKQANLSIKTIGAKNITGNANQVKLICQLDGNNKTYLGNNVFTFTLDKKTHLIVGATYYANDKGKSKHNNANGNSSSSSSSSSSSASSSSSTSQAPSSSTTGAVSNASH